ncbi:MAG: CRISPR-associated endonuclease Cas1 [Acetobacteraceae bacterium]
MPRVDFGRLDRLGRFDRLDGSPVPEEEIGDEGAPETAEAPDREELGFLRDVARNLEALSAAFPAEPIALYAGGAASFVQRGDERRTASGEQIKARIQEGARSRSRGRAPADGQSATRGGSSGRAQRGRAGTALPGTGARHLGQVMLNYGDAVPGSHARIETSRIGLDPSTAFLCGMRSDRPALILDPMEPLRPAIDARSCRASRARRFGPAGCTIGNDGTGRPHCALARGLVAEIGPLDGLKPALAGPPDQTGHEPRLAIPHQGEAWLARRPGASRRRPL